MPDTVDALLESTRGFVVAAAGCGKTQAIATAISRGGSRGRQLVLTHTHAGVKALRDRLAKFNVAEERVRVDTIAGWCLRYASAFPRLSELDNASPTSASWSEVYPAAGRALGSGAVQDVVSSSYAGLFVDEYQDCTMAQHAVILKVAALLPCRVLGDPLQGIFGFNDPLVDWDTDVAGEFEELPTLSEPHRWRNNKRLGQRLVELRAALLNGQQVDFRRPPFSWRQLPSTAEAQIPPQIAACEGVQGRQGSIVIVRRWPSECYTIAGKLQGRYTCMEEMDCKDLLKSASRIESNTGVSRCESVFVFAELCMTGVSTALRTIRQRVADGRLPNPAVLRTHRDVAESVVAVANAPDLAAVVPLLRLIEAVPDCTIFRRELWREMIRALQLHTSSGLGDSLRDAAWELRNRVRRQGRAVEKRTVSRTLLIKGLEFDHAVILDATEHDAKNFYVAATRPTSSLTICSVSPTQKF